jgi:hypothetical protein
VRSNFFRRYLATTACETGVSLGGFLCSTLAIIDVGRAGEVSSLELAARFLSLVAGEKGWRGSKPGADCKVPVACGWGNWGKGLERFQAWSWLQGSCRLWLGKRAGEVPSLELTVGFLSLVVGKKCWRGSKPGAGCKVPVACGWGRAEIQVMGR